jgi:hypothetical protein
VLLLSEVLVLAPSTSSDLTSSMLESAIVPFIDARWDHASDVHIL